MINLAFYADSLATLKFVVVRLSAFDFCVSGGWLRIAIQPEKLSRQHKYSINVCKLYSRVPFHSVCVVN